MQRDREPESSRLPPPHVMRSALGLAVPFALVWAITGTIVWRMILDTYGLTWPPPLRDAWVANLLGLLYAVFGVVCGLALRWFIWMMFEARPRKAPVREARARKDIKIGQNWDEI